MRRLLRLTAFLGCFLGGSTAQAWHHPHYRGVPVTTTAISSVPVTTAAYPMTAAAFMPTTAAYPMAAATFMPTTAAYPMTAAVPAVASYGCTGGSAATVSSVLMPATSNVSTTAAVNPVDIVRLAELLLARRPADTSNDQLLQKVNAIAEDVRSIKTDTSATTERLRLFLDTPSNGNHPKPSPGKDGFPTKPLRRHFSELQTYLQANASTTSVASQEQSKKVQDDLATLQKAQKNLEAQLKKLGDQLEKQDKMLQEILKRLPAKTGG